MALTSARWCEGKYASATRSEVISTASSAGCADSSFSFCPVRAHLFAARQQAYLVESLHPSRSSRATTRRRDCDSVAFDGRQVGGDAAVEEGVAMSASRRSPGW